MADFAALLEGRLSAFKAYTSKRLVVTGPEDFTRDTALGRWSMDQGLRINADGSLTTQDGYEISATRSDGLGLVPKQKCSDQRRRRTFINRRK